LPVNINPTALTQTASVRVSGINRNWNLKLMASQFARLKLFRVL
jgi:hypothetical protein